MLPISKKGFLTTLSVVGLLCASAFLGQNIKNYLRPATAEEQAYQSILRHGFEPVAMAAATPAQIESARLWRSIASSEPSVGDTGGEILSLNPANETLLPVIWHVAAQKAVALRPPKPADVGEGVSEIKVAELGAFNGGLAAVRIQILKADRHRFKGTLPQSRWGYVDSQGNWLATGFFQDATSFGGEIAIVEQNDVLRPINRQGKFLDKVPPIRLWSGGFHPVIPKRVGHWTWVKLAGSRPSAHEYIRVDFLTDGLSVHQIPENSRSEPSPDGLLWVLETKRGPVLWSLKSGFISLPEDLVPLHPLSAKTFLGPSRKTQGSAIYDLDGKPLADPAPIVSDYHEAPLNALAENRFVACEGNYSSDVYKDNGGDRQSSHRPRDYRCGIMDARGRWWAPPRFHIIEAQSDQHVLLQTADKACLVSLSQPNGPTDCTQTGSQQPVPVLQPKAEPPDYLQYGYRGVKGGLALDYRYDWATPFAGNVAHASQGMPGLIDAAGNWLTPQPSGSWSDVALVRAWAMVSKKLDAPTGHGLIDRQGNWVIPPVYASLSRYPDGSLCVRLPSRSWRTSCIHMDLAGRELPAVGSEALEQVKAAPAMASATIDPEVPQPVVTDTRPVLEAVSVNGRWGFQNAEGQWAIPPQFDDAADFSEGLGLVALRDSSGDKSTPKELITPQNHEEGEEGKTAEEPHAPPLHWGVIDANGKWVVKPRFVSIRPFHEGIAIANDGEVGLLSANGDWKPVPGLSDSSNFVNGVAQGLRPNGSVCRLTSDGVCKGASDAINIKRTDDRFAVAQQFVPATIRHDGPSRTTSTPSPQQGHYGYLGADGEWAISPRFTFAQAFEGDYAIASGKTPELPEKLRQQLVTTEVRLLGRGRFAAVTVVYPQEKPPASWSPRNDFWGASLPSSPMPMALATTKGEWLLPAQSRSWLHEIRQWLVSMGVLR